MDFPRDASGQPGAAAQDSTLDLSTAAVRCVVARLMSGAVERFSSLSVAVVLVVVLPVVVPLPVGVLIMTPVPIGIANPTTRTAINFVFAIFRLAPTSVPVVVAVNPHAMIAVRVAALVGMSKR
jgi:hypothetical protein